MTDSEKNAEIARRCGVKCRRCKGKGIFMRYGTHEFARVSNYRDVKQEPEVCDHTGEDGLGIPNLPNYCGSLDAMHEAEKTVPRHLWSEYTMNLRRIIQKECDTENHYLLGCERAQLIADFWFYHATAAQRCEAFLEVTSK